MRSPGKLPPCGLGGRNATGGWAANPPPKRWAGLSLKPNLATRRAPNCGPRAGVGVRTRGFRSAATARPHRGSTRRKVHRRWDQQAGSQPEKAPTTGAPEEEPTSPRARRWRRGRAERMIREVPQRSSGLRSIRAPIRDQIADRGRDQSQVQIADRGRGSEPGSDRRSERGCIHGRCTDRNATTAAGPRAGSTSQECHPVKAAAGGGPVERIPGPHEQIEALGGGGIGGPQALRGAVFPITIWAVDHPRWGGGSEIPAAVGAMGALQDDPPFRSAVNARAAALITA